MIKYVFFDMDGTLIDSEEYYIDGTYDMLLNNGFKGNKKDINYIIGTTLDVTYNYLVKLLDNRFTYQEIKIKNEEYFKENPINVNDRVYTDTVKGIMTLKNKGFKIAICSSSTRKEIEKFINILKLNDYIDYYISGEELKHSKPEPDIYLTTLDYFKASKNEAIILEDSYSGIKAGKNAGIYTVARKDIKFSIDQSEANYIVLNMNEFIKHIEDKKGY